MGSAFSAVSHRRARGTDGVATKGLAHPFGHSFVVNPFVDESVMM
jgi:hypothetical protein